MEGTIRWYFSDPNVVDKWVKDKLQPDKTTLFPYYFLEARFSFLDERLNTNRFNAYPNEVTAVIRFVSGMPLIPGFYLNPRGLEAYRSASLDTLVSLYHGWNEVVIAIWLLEVEDINAQKYSLQIRARNELVLREMIVLIREGVIKPAIPFGSSCVSGKEGE